MKSNGTLTKNNSAHVANVSPAILHIFPVVTYGITMRLHLATVKILDMLDDVMDRQGINFFAPCLLEISVNGHFLIVIRRQWSSSIPLPSESRTHIAVLLWAFNVPFNKCVKPGLWLPLINYSFPGEQCPSLTDGGSVPMHIGTINSVSSGRSRAQRLFFFLFTIKRQQFSCTREKLALAFLKNRKKIILSNGKLLEWLDNRIRVQCRGACFHPSKLTSEFVAPAEFCKLLHWSHLVRRL